MMSAGLAVLQMVLVLALWHDVCLYCSLTDGAGIGCYGMMSAGLTVLQMVLVLAVMA